ncbi:MAG: cadmium-translocating P-type ATPase [Alphaproteobacteria bacterium]|nr:MAG: cadmium-translocating P-type ATPase [Alphaproteobacteria bacterium]
MKPQHDISFDLEVAQHVHHSTLSVEGIRCASCIARIEQTLGAEEDVQHVRVNMTTSRLSITWHGDEGRVHDFIQILTRMGYHASRFYATTSTGYEEDNASDETSFLLRCVAVAGFAMGNIMLISLALWTTTSQEMGASTRELLHWVSALISIPTVLYAGRPFFASAVGALRHKRTNMDVPISLALILVTFMSVRETLQQGEHAYFDSAVMLLFFLLIGRWLDARAHGKAREAAQQLLERMRGEATLVLEDGSLQQMAIADLQEGDVVRVTMGEKIPADATILAGASEVDQSMITGESEPRTVEVGDEVYGGTMNLAAPITCRVMHESERSVLAEIIALMEHAEQGRARYVRLADRMARLYTPVVHVIALITFAGWMVLGNAPWEQALMIAVTTLIITCPCAIALAVPVAQVLATSWLMKRGILVKGGDALERLSEVDRVVLDKTGTMTLGNPSLLELYDVDYWHRAASLAAYSKHPYSRAISTSFQCYYPDDPLVELEEVEELVGLGISGRYGDDHVFLGKSDHPHPSGRYVAFWVNDVLVHEFLCADTLRPEAHETIQWLSAHDYDPIILSGDAHHAVEAVAHEVGMIPWRADMLPAQKAHYIMDVQMQDHKVLMVGDGLNDAPSLAAAHISISPASAMDMTQNSADVIMQRRSLSGIVDALFMGRYSTAIARQNFALAIGYNVFAVPLAMAGYVTPMIAAIAMSSSSLIVIANSFRIARQRSQL